MVKFSDMVKEVLGEEVLRERKGTIEFFKDKKDEYRWRIIAPTGDKIANCGEGYKNKKDCVNGLDSVRWHIDNSDVLENW
jgi:uncharacterized protein YegP (UPF0339 family)